MRISSKSGSSSMKLKIIPKVKKEKEKLHKQKSNSSLSGKRLGERSSRCVWTSGREVTVTYCSVTVPQNHFLFEKDGLNLKIRSGKRVLTMGCRVRNGGVTQEWSKST